MVAHNAASSACEKGYRWPWALQVLDELRGKQQVRLRREDEGTTHGKMGHLGQFLQPDDGTMVGKNRGIDPWIGGTLEKAMGKMGTEPSNEIEPMNQKLY